LRIPAHFPDRFDCQFHFSSGTSIRGVNRDEWRRNRVFEASLLDP
jgi:hypothetical protein